MSKYDRAKLAPLILRELSAGTPLRTICEAKGMPADSTFLGWVGADDTLAEQYARSRIAQAHRWADEIVHIADHGSGDVALQVNADARHQAVNVSVGRSALQRLVDDPKVRAEVLRRLYAQDGEEPPEGRDGLGEG